MKPRRTITHPRYLLSLGIGLRGSLWLILRIVAVLIILSLLLKRLSLEQVLFRLDPGAGPGSPNRKKILETANILDALLSWRFFHRNRKCLMRSLVLFRFSRLHGLPVGINFGVRRAAGGHDAGKLLPGDNYSYSLRGHSWLSLQGKPFLEDASHINIYSVTYRYPYQT